MPNSGKRVGAIPSNPAPLFTRIDPVIDFQWWDGAPRQDMNDDDFGVRWTGFLSAPTTGAYQVGAIGMNAFELYLDGKLIVQFNGIHDRAYRAAAVVLQAGQLYPVSLNFHEYVNDASIRLVWARPGGPSVQEAIDAARQADAVVLVLGLSSRLEGEEMRVPVEGFEGGDRVQLGLPRVQEELLVKLAESGKPTVLVLLNGSALAVHWARDHMPAIVEAWYPGQAGGAALADVLFGDYNPAGRLPVTFYKSADQLPPFGDYAMKGRTYRYFEGEPLFPFGYGLSYTSFAYRNLDLPEQAKIGDTVRVSVEVENTGKVAGEEVVQIYVSNTEASRPAPIRALAGFQRVFLRPKERKKVTFTLQPRQFTAISVNGKRIPQPDLFEISAGGNQPGSNVKGTITGKLVIR